MGHHAAVEELKPVSGGHLQIIVNVSHVGAMSQRRFVRLFGLHRASVSVQNIGQVAPSYTPATTH